MKLCVSASNHQHNTEFHSSLSKHEKRAPIFAQDVFSFYDSAAL